MLYKPKFCCECGNKIFRKGWGLWTSRRFCEVCEIENKAYDFFIKFLVLTAFAFGIIGAGGFFWKGKQGENTKEFLVKSGLNHNQKESKHIRFEPEMLINANSASVVESSKVESSKLNKKEVKIENEVKEIYFCGAMTKKGMPCKRRVKKPERCWQHLGQPAMFSQKELLVSKSS